MRTASVLLALLAVAPTISAEVIKADQNAFLAANQSRDVSDADADFDEMALINDNYDHGVIVGNVPYGQIMETPDATCNGPTDSGNRVMRYFYGATTSPNGANSPDATFGECYNDGELGDTVGATGNAFITFYWGVIPKGQPNEGCRCTATEHGTTEIGDAGSGPDGGTVINVCDVTTGWDGYHDLVFSSDCPAGQEVPARLHGLYVKPVDVKRGIHGQTGLNTLHTYGCDHVKVIDWLCKNADGALTSQTCDAECYEEFGCGMPNWGGNVLDADVNDGVTTKQIWPGWQQLPFVEMMVEIEIASDGSPPPDLYVYKPHPDVPDGMGTYNPGNFEASEKDTEGYVQSRSIFYYATYWSNGAFLKDSLQSAPTVSTQDGICNGCMDEAWGDVLTKLSTDNFHGPYAGSTGVPAFVMFDDHAILDVADFAHDASNPSADLAWGTGAYKPEDTLTIFTNRPAGGGGAGTWALLLNDDCDDASGAAILSWQLHFICRQDLFCTKRCQTCGDPHMVGFKGQKFDYHGQPGAAFNVVTTPRTHMNAFLKSDLVNGLTYVGTVGLQLDSGSKLLVSAVDGTTMHVEMNDVPVKAFAQNNDMEVKVDGMRLVVKCPEMSVVIVLNEGAYLNIVSITLHSIPERMHGVLGNTANLSSEETYVGDDADYFVSNLWATDFKHNAFNARGAAPRTKAAVKELAITTLEDGAVHDLSADEIVSASMLQQD